MATTSTDIVPVEDSPTSPPLDPNTLSPAVEFLAKLMDDLFQIPGTNIRIGLDGLIGLIPGVGDLAGALVGTIVLQEANRLGVSRWTKARMIGNYTLDFVLSLVPFAGDVLDFGFKAHRKNVRLLQQHLAKKLSSHS